MILHRPHIGIVLVMCSTVCVALGWGGIKLAGSRLPTSEVVFFRALVGLIILGLLTYLRAGTLKGVNHRLLVLRGILGLIGMMLMFHAMTRMLLGDAAMLLNTFPLFVALIAPFFLKEPSKPAVFTLIAVAFVGIALILKPSSALVNGTALMALGAGIVTAFAMMSIRKLHATENTLRITWWFTLVITLGSAPLAAAQFVVPTIEESIILIFVGLILTLSQLLLTKAYRYAPASVLAPFSYLTVLWSYGLDIAIWGHVPDFWSLVGGAIVVAAGIGIIKSAHRPLVRPYANS